METGTAAYVVQAGGDRDEKCRESKGRYREKNETLQRAMEEFFGTFGEMHGWK